MEGKNWGQLEKYKFKVESRYNRLLTRRKKIFA